MWSGLRMPSSLLQRVALGKVLADEGGVDGAVDHRRAPRGCPGAQLARHALGQRAQAVLGAGEGGEAVAAAHAGGGAGEDDRAAAARHHAPWRPRARPGSRRSRPSPRPCEDPRGGLADAEADVRADVEDADLDRARSRARCRRTAPTISSSLRASTPKACASPPAVADRVDEGLAACRRGGADDRGVALAGEAPGDRAARGVAGADDDDRLVGHAGH